jgi:hypothetical protein
VERVKASLILDMDAHIAVSLKLITDDETKLRVEKELKEEIRRTVDAEEYIESKLKYIEGNLRYKIWQECIKHDASNSICSSLPS